MIGLFFGDTDFPKLILKKLKTKKKKYLILDLSKKNIFKKDTNSFSIGIGQFGSIIKLLIAVTITTIVWILATFLTNPESEEVLINFVTTVHPGGPGWKKVVELSGDTSIETQKKWDLPYSLLNVFLGCVAIYSALFSTGYFIYGNVAFGLLLGSIFFFSVFLMIKTWPKLNLE